MKRTGIYVALIVCLPVLLSAQPLQKAQSAMEKFDYTHAISILKKIADDGKFRDEAVPMLAECYRMQNDVYNSRAWYSRAAALPGAKPETFLYYGQALQATGEYSAARDMFRKYAGMSSDGKGARLVAHCDSVLGPWKGKKPQFEVRTVSPINSTESDFGPAFYSGRLVFASDYIRSANAKKYGWTGRGYLDLMQSSPSVTGDFWGSMETPATFEGGINQEYHDGPACFSRDGNTIFFTRSYKDKGKNENGIRTNLLKIFYAVKTDGKWGDEKPFFLNSPDYSIGHPVLSADGQTLYFASDMPGGEGGTDLWMCTREGDGWSKPVNLGKTINTPENEMFPYISEAGDLFFASAGHPGYGGLDLFRSSPANGSWSSPVNLQPPLNGSFDDFALAFAPGADGGFFSSNRPGGKGNDDIYAFRRLEVPVTKEPVTAPAYITGVVKDKVTMQPLEGATVFALNPNTGKVLVLKTGPDGVYKAPVERPGDFVVKGMKPNYIADCTPFPLSKIVPGTTTTAPRDLLLDKLELNRVIRVENIYYNFDKYDIRADARPELDKLVRIMQENPVTAELGSHTDCRGSFAYNDRLSQNRAASAVNYIISRGIEKSRITAKGYGEHQLVNQCADGVACSEAEHQMNRRTEFKITGYSSPAQQAGQFNPDLFGNNEELDARFLPGGFFNPCQ